MIFPCGVVSEIDPATQGTGIGHRVLSNFALSEEVVSTINDNYSFSLFYLPLRLRSALAFYIIVLLMIILKVLRQNQLSLVI